MTRLLLAALAGFGVALALGGRDGPTAGALDRTSPAERLRRAWSAGRTDLAAVGASTLAAGLVTWTVVAAAVPTLAVAALVGTVHADGRRRRHQRERAEASDAWPRLIEEIRVLTSAAGRSIPQAVLDTGVRAPASMQPAFAAAQREWQLTTDFRRVVTVLRDALDDPSADLTLETLLVAHEVGGAGLDRRLATLAEDRAVDVANRRDAAARQAGVRFARRFVLLVPAGMAAVGFTIEGASAAYATGAGQLMVASACALTGACWWWSGRILRLPQEARVVGTRGAS